MQLPCISTLLCWVNMLTLVAMTTPHDHVQYACPSESWCLPDYLCPEHDRIQLISPFVCGATDTSSGHVCCSSQRFLREEFVPSIQQWHYLQKIDHDDTGVVLPWPEADQNAVFQEGDENIYQNQWESTESVFSNTEFINTTDVQNETSSRDTVDEHLLSSFTVDEILMSVNDGVDNLLFSGQICPDRSLCLPWVMCHSSDVMVHDNKIVYLCGQTSDTINSVCCQSSKLLHNMAIANLVDYSDRTPHEFGSSSELQETMDEVPVAPYSLEELAAAYDTFTTPPPTSSAPTESQNEPYRGDLDRILLGIGVGRSRRDLSAFIQRSGAVRLGTLTDLKSGRLGGTVSADADAIPDDTEDDVFNGNRPIESISSIKRGNFLPAETDNPSLSHSKNEVLDGSQYSDIDDSSEDLVKPLKAPILDGRESEDREVNGRSMFGVFLDNLLDIPTSSPVLLEEDFSDEDHHQDETTESAVGSGRDKLSRHHHLPLSHSGPFAPGFHSDSSGSRLFGSTGTPQRPFRVFNYHPQYPQVSSPRPPLDLHGPISEHHHPSHDYILPKKCGQSSSLGVHARITGGGHGADAGATYAQYGQFPWHVAILLADDLSYKCAGVLVSSRAVITVAHCVISIHSRLLARVGDWDLSSDKEVYPAYDVPIINYVVHPDFYAGSLLNDIAVLNLAASVDQLPNVQPACLPPPRSSAHFIGQQCSVTGWGQARRVRGDLHDSYSYSWRLRTARLTVISPTSCERQLRHTQLGSFYRLPRLGALCAVGGGGADACFGDGGGGLVCRYPDHQSGSPYHVAGLVSWGIGCGQNIPGVYTSVSDYYDWILHQLSAKSLTSSH